MKNLLIPILLLAVGTGSSALAQEVPAQALAPAVAARLPAGCRVATDYPDLQAAVDAVPYPGGIHSWGYNSIGLYAQGSTADISINGGYHSNRGFASIYLDGTRANVGDSAFRDLRIEGETGLYCLYATGAVRNVTIDSGNWGSAGEVVRYEAAAAGHAANSGAEGWSIRNASLTIQDQSVRSPQATGALCKLPRDQRAILRLDRMANCRIENIWVRAYQIVRAPKAAADGKPDDHGTVIQNQAFSGEDKLEYYPARLIACAGWAHGNTIVTGKREDVVLPADAHGNQVVALDEQGVRRTYLGAGGGAEVLNLTPVDVRTLKAPRVGDVALDNGSLCGNGKPSLVFFDGQQWCPAAGTGN